MKTITVNRKQNIVDVCLQVYGTTQLLFKFADDNSLEIDSDISAGDELVYDETLGDKLVIEKIQRQDLRMINPLNPEILVTEGIGAWIIESTFEVQ